MTRAVVLFIALVVAGCAAGEEREADKPTKTTTGAEAGTPTAPPAKQARRRGTDAGAFGDIPDVVQEVQPSVVAVQVDEGEGSGVIWSEDGIVVTNHHVVEGTDDVAVVFASGRRTDARVRATYPATDLAVLVVDAVSLPAAEFTD